MLRNLNQGPINFKQFAASIRQLVNDCNIQNAEDKELLIRNFIVTGANCQAAYRQCVAAGPNAKHEEVLDIYRNEAAVQAHFQRRHSSLPTVHQLDKEDEEDVHKNCMTPTNDDTTKMPNPQTQRID